MAIANTVVTAKLPTLESTLRRTLRGHLVKDVHSDRKKDPKRSHI